MKIVFKHVESLCCKILLNAINKYVPKNVQIEGTRKANEIPKIPVQDS